MKDKSLNSIEEYEQEIEKYKIFWKSIEISTVIGKQEGKWILLGMQVSFSERHYSKDVCDILLQTPSIRMVKEIKDVKYINDLFNGLKSKSLKIANLDTEVDEFDFGWGRSKKKYNPMDIEIDWPIIWLRGYGSSKDLINERVDKELNQLGYEALSEESKDNLGFYVGAGYGTHIYFIAPIYIRIDSGTLKGNKMGVKVLSHNSVPLDDIRIVSPVMKGKPLPLTEISERDNFRICHCEVKDIPVTVDSVTVRGYYKDEPEPIDIEWILRVPEEIHNHRAAVLSSLNDKDLLKKYLGLVGRITPPTKGKRQKLDSYEIACMNLLSCAGFAVFNFGRGLDIEGADLVAFSPNSKDILIVSCTVTTAIGEKIAKIKPIRNLLKEKLKDHNFLSIICSPAPYEDFTNGNIDSCKNEGIALITAKEMEKIYDLSMSGDCNEIINYIKDLTKKSIYEKQYHRNKGLF